MTARRDPAAARAGRWHLAVSLGLAALVLLTFFPVLAAGFAPFDDDVQLYGNEHITALSADNLRWMFTDTALTQRYTPLSWVTWALVYAAAGMRPAAFHLQALLLHALNAVLLYFVVYELLRRFPTPRADKPWTLPVCAGVGAALWAVHPMRVEVLGWATQVRYAEACTGALGAVLMYLAAVRRAPDRPMHSAWFWGALASYAASLLFYPSAVTLFLLLPALDVLLLKRRPAGARAWGLLLLEKTPFLAAAALAGAMTLYGRVTAAGMWGHPVPLSEFGIADRALQAVYVLAFYLWKPLDPVHASHLYTQAAYFRAAMPGSLASLALVLAISGAALVLRRRYPRVALLWAAHVLLLLPFGGYFEHPYLLGDRYAYLQGTLLAIVVAGALAMTLRQLPMAARLRTFAAPACAAVVLALASLSHAHSYRWHDGVTLMRATLDTLAPDDPYRKNLYWQLGKAHLDAGQFAEAIDAAGRTLSEDPANPYARRVTIEALIGLSRDRQKADDPEGYRALSLRAATLSDQLAQADPSAENLRAAALLYQRADRLDLAEPRFIAALAADPGDVDLRLRLAELYARQGRTELAAQTLDAAVGLAPSLAPQRDSLLRKWTQATQPASAPSTSPR